MDKKRILIVDDDPDFVDSIKVIVEDAGFDIAAAYDGKEGLGKVDEFKPDLIILDVMMPVMNGHEACKALKGNPDTAEIPIILLTAVADRVTSSTYTHRDMLESEAEDYLPKPIKPEELLERIKSWLE